MSTAKTKVISFRVSGQNFETLRELASRLHQMEQIKSDNPHLLAKEYTFAFANIVMKMNNWTQTTEQDQMIFSLTRGMADTVKPSDGQSG